MTPPKTSLKGRWRSRACQTGPSVTTKPVAVFATSALRSTRPARRLSRATMAMESPPFRCANLAQDRSAFGGRQSRRTLNPSVCGLAATHATLAWRAEVAEWQTRYVQGVVSLRSCGFKSHLRHQTRPALGAQRVERSPAEAGAGGSSPTQRAI